MIKKLSFVLSLVLVLTLFAGCTVEEKLERVEDRAESFVERQEDKAEQYLDSKLQSTLSTQSTQGAQATEPTQGAQSLSEEPVTKEQAEEIALQYAGFSRDQVTGLRTEFEIDDGISQYNVEFRLDGWEYEFEIHEKTGKILSYDKDQERY